MKKLLFSAVLLFTCTVAQAHWLQDAFKNGTPWVQLRLRHERADIDNDLRDANATTLKTVLGYKTGEVHDWQALLEFENVSALGPHRFDSSRGTSPAQAGVFDIIADPKGTEVNQAYLRYLGLNKTDLKLGRQRILINNQRFVGGVAFRQNEQTFDAFDVSMTPVPDLKLHYAFVFRVNRIFGASAISGSSAYTADSHFFDAHYQLAPVGHISPYAFFISNKNSSSTAAPSYTSNRTYGIRLTNDLPVRGMHVLYVAEYAHQSDAFNNPDTYSEDYYHFVLGARCAYVTGKLGYEVLGGDGEHAFQTPYATLHKFNGWADMFLSTPSDGLQDMYAVLSAKLPFLMGAKADVIYHHFEADHGSDSFGNEIDLSLAKQFLKHYTLSVQYADFNSSNGSYRDTRKLWLTAEVRL